MRTPEMKVLGTCCQIIGAIGIVTIIFLSWDLLHYQPEYTPTPERKQCVANLEQLCMAFKLWAMQHTNQFPFSVSTNAGGSLEYCARGPDGLDANSYLHFQTASNEIILPSLLVCPDDPSKTPARDFQSLQSTNVSYHLQTAMVGGEQNQVLAVCPIHGYTLHVHGDVDVLEVARDSGRMTELLKYWRYDGKFRQGAKQILASMTAACILVLTGTWLKHKRYSRML